VFGHCPNLFRAWPRLSEINKVKKRPSEPYKVTILAAMLDCIILMSNLLHASCHKMNANQLVTLRFSDDKTMNVVEV